MDSSEREQVRAFLTDALAGHEQAVDYCLLLIRVASVWDDLVDGDKPVTTEDVNAGFMAALIDLPMHPFFRQHGAFLMPVLIQSANDWQTANLFEKSGGEYEHHISYVIRSSVMNVVTVCAYIVGGSDLAKQANAKVHYGLTRETFADYLNTIKE
jgi:hypothetical protein